MNVLKMETLLRKQNINYKNHKHNTIIMNTNLLSFQKSNKTQITKHVWFTTTKNFVQHKYKQHKYTYRKTLKSDIESWGRS